MGRAIFSDVQKKRHFPATMRLFAQWEKVNFKKNNS
jgi:hypothetical protein